MKYCSKCNIHFSTEGNFCEKCGNRLTAAAASFCTECGAKLEDGAMFCGSCGTRINNVVASRPGTQPDKTEEPVKKGPVILKKKSIPKNATIAAIVVAVLLLGGGGYYFLTHNTKTVSKVLPNTSTGINVKNGNNTKATGKGVAGNSGKTVQAPPIRSGAVSKAYHSSADREGSYIHSASLAVDGNPATCWSEGVSGLGIGENIVIHFNGTYKVSGLNIWIGHQKSESLFYQNARPTRIRIEGADGSGEVHSLRDTFGAQRVEFKQPITTDRIKIVVDQVLPGNKYADTCIAEVSFF